MQLSNIESKGEDSNADTLWASVYGLQFPSFSKDKAARNMWVS